jgi:hypothetical protein
MVINKGPNLIRLHKRAVSRFISLDINSPSCSAEDIQYLFEIWLSYAHAQARFGSSDAARTTFRHIQYRRIGEKEAKFYIALAEFEMKTKEEENYRDVAKGVIEDGIEKGAEPKKQLISYLEYLNMEDEKEKISSSNVENVKAFEPQNVQIMNEVKDCPSKSNQSDKSSFIEGDFCNGEKSKKADKGSILKSSSSSLSILSKRRKIGGSRTSRGAFGGGAMRISTISEMDQTVDEDDDEQDEPNSDISYLLNWTPNGPSTEAAKQAVLQQRAAKRKGTTIVNEGPTKVFRSNFQFQPVMDVIEETLKEQNSSSTASNHSNPSLSHGPNSGSSSAKHESSGELTKCMEGKLASDSISTAAINTCEEDTFTNKEAKVASDIKSEKNDDGRKSNPDSNEHVNDKESPSVSHTASAPSVHPDFLKIVSERNILYVNNIPYVKLGVIGKGGSCKVYRTLSKDRNIVAIKKVKIAGMARKSIEGYANEIALLRKLRGNPAIIQLYDSEVDFQRKAIYLVMEPGEVDLNYVVSLCHILCQTVENNLLSILFSKLLSTLK